MLDLIYLLNNSSGTIGSAGDLCKQIEPILRLVGIVVFGIKVVVPIMLIVVGMLDLAKAVTEKNEDNIKKAQQALIKKAIAAVIVFLIVTIVALLMNLIGNRDYEKCMDCINDPWSCSTGQEG